jgi:transposase, IS30 family
LQVRGRPGCPGEVESRFWFGIRGHLSIEEAAGWAGVSRTTGQKWFIEAGGVMPPAQAPGRVKPRLRFEQREEIAVLHGQKLSNAEIARQIGCHRSTVGRELKLGTTVRDKQLPVYRASVAQKKAEWRARRPKLTKLAGSDRLRQVVQAELEKEHSPEQIANRLVLDYPDDSELRVSHETMYKALYVQGRGELRRDLHRRLRTGRALRQPRRSTGERRGRIPGMINIAERPPEADNRSVPGHWEGDLITGANNQSAIGTLVERASGFCLLLHLPEGHGADAVEQAMIAQISRLPETLRRTLAWDQGSEMANHAQIAAATELDIYFCDPHSPWQRGSNENTNGLLRQYFPKGSDLTVYQADYLDHVAAKLNNRPRKRHHWRTPAEVLDQLLSHPQDQPVASTG